MTVWITGANGFIGRHLAQALADAGHSVHGVGHGALEEIDKNRLGLQLWLNGEIDATNFSALADRSGLPSTVFHLAGGSSVALSIAQPHEDFFRTVVSTARLLEWLRGSAPECRLISVSSAAVYGANHRGQISEDALTLPMSPYGQHKLMMEQLCQSYANTFGLRSTVTRLFSVYGPHLRKQLLWDLCWRLYRGDRTLVLGGTGAEMRDWTDVRDVARFLVKVNDGPQSKPFEVINGGSGIGTSVAEIAGALTRNWSRDIAVKFSGVVREGDPFSLVADSAFARAVRFNWQIPVAQGITDYVSWFKASVH
jgi:UDP-glucose 4-epimerase